jgi:hypothetical protein
MVIFATQRSSLPGLRKLIIDHPSNDWSRNPLVDVFDYQDALNLHNYDSDEERAVKGTIVP